MYGVAGERTLAEWEACGLAGGAGSAPARIGHAGGAGGEDAAAFPDPGPHAAGGHVGHTCEGARPLAHISFGSCISRSVSMHGQNPPCRYTPRRRSCAKSSSTPCSRLTLSASDMRANTSRSKTKKPPLIQPSATWGFSRKDRTQSPSTESSPNRDEGCTAVTVASRPARR